MLEIKRFIAINETFQWVEQSLGNTEDMKLRPIYGVMKRQDILLGGSRAGKVAYEDAVDHNCHRFGYCVHKSS
jgi:hypothetical protein